MIDFEYMILRLFILRIGKGKMAIVSTTICSLRTRMQILFGI